MSQTFTRVTIDADGLREVDRFFDLSAAGTEDLHEPLSDLMDQLLESVAQQFDTEGAAAHGARWAPLSDDYAKWKAAHYPGFPLLVASGQMKRAMLDENTAVQVGAEEAVYEPVSDIAGYHQHGETWWGNAWSNPGPYLHVLPQRKMVDLSEAFEHEAVDRTFARWLTRMLQEASALSDAGVRIA